ncbi:MAG: ABC transporter permease [Ignavibacteriales bacterium]|nr:ABC transporter permease [Ignavibacteriales bacterium]
MFSSYLKIALRNLQKNKVYSAINIAGLSVGIACCMLILLHVYSELQFDRFHKNAEKLYRVNYIQGTVQGERTIGRNMPPLAAALKEEFPEVEASTHFLQGWRLTVKREASNQTGLIARNYFFSGSETFHMFDFPFLYGDPAAALKEPGAVVLTEDKAAMLFGESNPVGERLYIEAEDFPEFGMSTYTVTGVLKRLPANSHLQFDFLISTSTLERFESSREWIRDWDNYQASTYVLLQDEGMESAVESKLAAFTKKYVPEEEGYTKGFVLQPFTDVHFGSSDIAFELNVREGDMMYVRIFLLLALFVAGIACVNYMNLATARAMKRAKEVALRKVVGADRLQMAGQFLFEAIVQALISFLLAIGLVEFALPTFNSLAGNDLSIALIFSPPVLGALIGLALLVGLIAGSYPAFYLSGLTPSLILRGETKTGRGGVRLRNALVVLQFVVTIVMIVATVVVSRQLGYVTTKELGFNRDQLVVFDINHDSVQENFINVKNELLRNASVKSVAVSSRVPGDWKSYRRFGVTRADQPASESVRMVFNGVDEDFLRTYEMDLTQGRNFSRAFASDSNAVILNETAAKALFTESPIGKTVRFSSSNFTGIVIGVVRDFHFESLHDRIEPLALGFMPAGGRHALWGIDYFTMRIAGENVQETIDFLSAVHARFDPINPIELGFLDEWWMNLYERDQRLGTIFSVAAGLAILIACIGLFGLAAFMAEQRTKEIGVRKILGASVGSIVKLLSGDFARLILLGLIIATPLAYWAMDRWLEGFAYRIEIGWWVFVLAGGLALLIALLTVSMQALKAALANPVEALRYE